MASGSLLAVNGDAGAGTIRLRAPVVGNDVAITGIGARVEGPTSVIIEPVTVFNVPTATLTVANLNAFRAQLASFVDAATTPILGRLADGPGENRRVLGGG